MEKHGKAATGHQEVSCNVVRSECNSCESCFSRGGGKGGGGGGGLTWLHAPRMMADTSEMVLVVCSRDKVGIRWNRQCCDEVSMGVIRQCHDDSQHQAKKDSAVTPCISCEHQTKSNSAMTICPSGRHHMKQTVPG